MQIPAQGLGSTDFGEPLQTEKPQTGILASVTEGHLSFTCEGGGERDLVPSWQVSQMLGLFGRQEGMRRLYAQVCTQVPHCWTGALSGALASPRSPEPSRAKLELPRGSRWEHLKKAESP